MTNRSILAVAPALALAACGGAKMISTPLHWSPTDDLNDLHQVTGQTNTGFLGATVDVTGPDMSGQVMDAFSGQSVQIMPLADTRTQKDAIGSNVEKSDPRPVTTKDDVALFVTEHVGDVLKACHVNVVSGGGSRVLKGEVLEYFTKEDNRYNASATLKFTLTDAGGKEIWSGLVVGKQNKFGHSFSADNYNECLSDALVRAVHQLLTNQAFLTAVHKGKA
jgi:hypothetical protein